MLGADGAVVARMLGESTVGRMVAVWFVVSLVWLMDQSADSGRLPSAFCGAGVSRIVGDSRGANSSGSWGFAAVPQAMVHRIMVAATVASPVRLSIFMIVLLGSLAVNLARFTTITPCSFSYVVPCGARSSR